MTLNLVSLAFFPLVTPYKSLTEKLFFRGRCLPMNLRAEDLASGVLRDRVKVGASLADVDPMNLDTSVSNCHFSTKYFNRPN